MSKLKHTRRLFMLGAALLAIVPSAVSAQTLAKPLDQSYRAILPQKVETGDRIEVIDFFWYG